MWYKGKRTLGSLARIPLYVVRTHYYDSDSPPPPRPPFPDSRLVWHRSACYRKGESGVSELIILARCDNRRFQRKGRKGAIETRPFIALGNDVRHYK